MEKLWLASLRKYCGWRPYVNTELSRFDSRFNVTSSLRVHRNSRMLLWGSLLLPVSAKSPF